jgi:putative PEP-CTERM system TPR-repeat lipoprotein
MKSTLIFALILLLCGCSTDPQKAKQKYFESGQRYMKKGQHSAAIVQFRNALAQDPRFVDALHLLAQAYVANRQPREAYAALKQAADIDPNRLDVRLSLSRFYLAAGGFQQAAEQADFVVARDQKSAAAYQVLGVALAAQKENEGARKALEKAVELAPKDPSSLVSLGLILAADGNRSEAERNLRAATEADPRHLPAWLALADLYRRQERLPEAEQVLQTALERNPDEINLYLASADLLLAQAKTEPLEALLRKLRERLRKPETALALGDFFASRNQRERAMAEYRRGLETAPNNLDIKARLVEHHLAAGQIKEAERWNSEILGEKPKDVQAGIARGRILLAQGKREEAITELRQQVSQARDSAQPHFYLAEAYLRNLNPSQAKAELQEAIRLAPGFLPARLGLGDLQMKLGDLASARETAEAAVSMFPAAAGARLLLGNVVLRQRDFAGARQHLLAARELAPNDPAVLVSLGVSYAGERRWVEAEKEIESALKLNPRHAPALSELAGIWMAAGQPAKAIARLQQHTAAYPDYPHGHLVLGALHRQARDYGPAETELARAVQLDPNLMQARLQLGGVYHDQGHLDAAIQQFEAALKLEPRSSSLHVLLGTAQYEKGEPDAARKHFAQALAIDPNSALAANNLAAASAAHGGNLDEALALAQKARELAPDLVNAADTLGWIQYKKGLHQAALPLLEECVRKAPESATYRYHLGMVLVATGQKEKARGHLEAALRLKLSGEDAVQAREGLAKIR